MVEVFLAYGIYRKKDGRIKDNKTGNINLRGRSPRRQQRAIKGKFGKQENELFSSVRKERGRREEENEK